METCYIAYLWVLQFTKKYKALLSKLDMTTMQQLKMNLDLFFCYTFFFELLHKTHLDDDTIDFV